MPAGDGQDGEIGVFAGLIGTARGWDPGCGVGEGLAGFEETATLRDRAAGLHSGGGPVDRFERNATLTAYFGVGGDQASNRDAGLGLDPVFYLAALAVHAFVELVGRAVEIGHDEPWVSPLGPVFDAGDDPPGAPPSARCIGELGELGLTRGEGDRSMASRRNAHARPHWRGSPEARRASPPAGRECATAFARWPATSCWCPKPRIGKSPRSTAFGDSGAR